MSGHGISDELINAFIDGELAAPERERVLQAIDADAVLRERVCALRAVKQQLAHAYDVAAPSTRPVRSPARRAVAVAGLVALGAAGGWLLRAALWPGHAGRAADGTIVHISSADDARVRAALDTAESLLVQARASRTPIAVEVVANGSGLDALRVGTARHSERIAALKAHYPNLAFVACGQTIERLRERGIEPVLLPGTATASSALDEIVLRMKAGWRYIGA